MFDVGSVVAHITADIGDFKKKMGDAQNAADNFGKGLGSVGNALKGVGQQAAIFSGIVAAGVVVFGKQSVDAFNESEAAVTQLRAVLKSTGSAAGVFEEDILDQAQALQKMTKFSDEAVVSSANLLLTFTNIKGPIMQEAIATTLDMSQALGQDLKSSSIQLGKALNDPIKGITALSRVGVSFTEQQKATITSLVESGKTMEAQKIILKELSVEFGGSARMAGTTFAGQVEILKNQFGELQEKVGAVITGFVLFMSQGVMMATFLDALGMTEDDPLIQGLYSFREALIKIGEWIKANQELVIMFVKGLAIGLAALLIIGTITGLLALLLNPLTLIVVGITLLFAAWQSNFLGIRDITMAVVNELVSVFNNILMPIIQAVANWVTAHWTQIRLITEGTFNIIKGIIQIAWAAIYAIFSIFLALLTGDWKTAWENIKHAMSIAWDGIKSIFSGVFSYIKAWGQTVLDALIKPFNDAWNAIQETVRKIRDALDFTKRHSPSVVDIVQRGVRLVNSSLDDLNMDIGGVHPTVSPSLIGGSSSNQSMNSISIDLTGAVISDENAAMRIGEMIGDNIIRKLGSNVRF